MASNCKISLVLTGGIGKKVINGNINEEKVERFCLNSYNMDTVKNCSVPPILFPSSSWAK